MISAGFVRTIIITKYTWLCILLYSVNSYLYMTGAILYCTSQHWSLIYNHWTCHCHIKPTILYTCNIYYFHRETLILPTVSQMPIWSLSVPCKSNKMRTQIMYFRYFSDSYSYYLDEVPVYAIRLINYILEYKILYTTFFFYSIYPKSITLVLRNYLWKPWK